MSRSTPPPPWRQQGSRLVLASVVTALVASTLPGLASPASAAPVDGVTPTTTTLASSVNGTATPLAGLSVTSSDPANQLQVDLATTRGTLSFPTRTGVTLGFGNAWSGTSSVSFSGTESSVNQALRDVRLVGSGTPGAATVELSSMRRDSDRVYASPNRHFYEYVPADGIGWVTAKAAAESRTYKGKRGYLATMPSKALNDFVSSRIEGATNVWFGAGAVNHAGGANLRTWSWSGGPLAGQVITTCANATGPCVRTDGDARFTSWAEGEPNNSGANETAAVTNWGGSVGMWNDLAAGTSQGGIGGYVVEYGDAAFGPGDVPFEDFHSTSSQVTMATAPQAPGSPAVTAGDGTATISFTAPNDNGSPVTEYVVRATASGQPPVEQVCAAPASTCTVTGLTNGTSYTVDVAARNAAGESSRTTGSSVTPATTPGSPSEVSAVRGDRSASVSFSAPADNGGAAVTSYTVTSSPGGAVATCSTSPCQVTGLENGTAYTFTVTARNVAGPSAPSAESNSVTAAGAPGAPGNASAEHGDGTAVVSFDAAAANGSPVSTYVVTATGPGAETVVVECGASPCTLPGLTNGTQYAVSVAAVNEVGTGASSQAGSITPATTPDAPGTVTVERGARELTVSFDAPPSDGGSAVTGYEVSVDGGRTWTSLTTTGTTRLTGTVAGLTNGETYDVSVRAVNAEGTSAPSTGQGTPAEAPDAPRTVSATRGDASVTVAFSAPERNNGSAVTSYTVTSQPGGRSATCTSSPCTVTGLTNGTAYTFDVVATNDVGDSPVASSGSVVPVAVAGAPRELELVSQDGAATLSFRAPESDGGTPVTSYEVSVDGGDWTTLTTTSEQGVVTASVPGLTNGTEHGVRVRAVNDAGAGAPSESQTVTPAGKPGAVSDVSVRLRGQVATLSWQAPADDGGSPVTGYVVTAQPGGLTCETTTATTCEIAGLDLGTAYTFVVQAVNLQGGSAGTGVGTGSSSTPVTPRATPDAPRDVVASGGDRTITVSWTAPDDSGTSAVAGYEVSLDGGVTWQRVTTTGTGRLSAVVEAVRNGRAYPVRVRAANSSGQGAAGLATTTQTAQWFRDPMTAAQRASQVAVPRSPRAYRGPVRTTRQAARAVDGTPAMPLRSLGGRQLQSGQAATLLSKPMFGRNDARLTPAARRQLMSMVSSLRYVDAVRCEGHVDYGGGNRRARQLSVARARVVCDALVAYGADVRTSARGYGNTRPVVIGKAGSKAREASRRVVIMVTRG